MRFATAALTLCVAICSIASTTFHAQAQSGEAQRVAESIRVLQEIMDAGDQSVPSA
jgi:hypothetical protein